MIDFKNINSKFDLIVSNPPYLTNEQFNNADPEVKNFEPKLALVGGDDGLKFYREYSNNLKNLMNKSAYFVCEIGINQRQDCEEIFENSKGESESVAGFILEVVQVFPKVGQVIKYKGFKFFIEAVDQKRIKRIKVILPPSP